jgi:hypothetical protein
MKPFWAAACSVRSGLISGLKFSPLIRQSGKAFSISFFSIVTFDLKSLYFAPMDLSSH